MGETRGRVMKFLCDLPGRKSVFNFLSVLLLFSLTACGGSNNGGGSTVKPTVIDLEAYTAAGYAVTGGLGGSLSDPSPEEKIPHTPDTPRPSYAIAENGKLGTATLRTAGSWSYYYDNNHFEYTPHPGAEGVDTFTYTLTDRYGTSEPGTVTVTIGPPPTPTPPIPADIERVSVSDELEPAIGPMWGLAIDGTGDRVAFISYALNLAPPSVPESRTEYSLVIVRDLERGTTERMPIPDGFAGHIPWESASLSDDGDRVAYVAGATRFSDSGNPYYIPNILVHDRGSGKTEVASQDKPGQPSTLGATHADLSGNGRYVTFLEQVQTPEGNWDYPFIRQRDLQTHKVIDPSQTLPDGDSYSYSSAAQTSADGRWLLFTARSESFSRSVLVLHDMETDSARILAKGPEGTPARVNVPRISTDGAWVAYFTNAPLDPADTNGVVDAYLEEIATGKITRMTVDTDRYPDYQGYGLSLSISGDGHFTVFALNHINHNVRQRRIHLFDRETGETIELTRHAWNPEISTDGSRIAFVSVHPDLMEDLPYISQQIYLMPNPLAGPVSGDD